MGVPEIWKSSVSLYDQWLLQRLGKEREHKSDSDEEEEKKADEQQLRHPTIHNGGSFFEVRIHSFLYGQSWHDDKDHLDDGIHFFDAHDHLSLWNQAVSATRSIETNTHQIVLSQNCHVKDAIEKLQDSLKFKEHKYDRFWTLQLVHNGEELKLMDTIAMKSNDIVIAFVIVKFCFVLQLKLSSFIKKEETMDHLCRHSQKHNGQMIWNNTFLGISIRWNY
ncbi:hypothetical protein RFI_08984 [Reticulomyxa filosa]|uniref:Ubiquitin-like domain-containing protein n=1 Tax=Reticulomyxa filosa TaxID=46433 RepID=X6NPD4_RETFI|nr:hypothetical protein RFI_08984 [Reticulomyxa filosa]|eukprot:ETO28145.1 hypothetical protein RFI_08984 [Reticulomyxa filosa]